MIPQKSFQYDDFLLKKHLLLLYCKCCAANFIKNFVGKYIQYKVQNNSNKKMRTRYTVTFDQLNAFNRSINFFKKIYI